MNKFMEHFETLGSDAVFGIIVNYRTSQDKGVEYLREYGPMTVPLRYIRAAADCAEACREFAIRYGEEFGSETDGIADPYRDAVHDLSKYFFPHEYDMLRLVRLCIRQIDVWHGLEAVREAVDEQRLRVERLHEFHAALHVDSCNHARFQARELVALRRKYNDAMEMVADMNQRTALIQAHALQLHVNAVGISPAMHGYSIECSSGHDLPAWLQWQSFEDLLTGEPL